MGKTIEETKFAQVDFSGGFNSNPRIGPISEEESVNELQICENLDLHDFGKMKPAFQDTLIKAITAVTAIGVVDRFLYYLVGIAFSRVKGEITDSLGSIGTGVFFVEKFGDVHIIIASDKIYKVLIGSDQGLTLAPLGTAAPTTAPTLALSTRNSLVIDDMEDASGWTASGLAVADDAVNKKVGTNSMKLTVSAANTIEYATKTIAVDLTQYADETASDDEDLIAMWIYVTDPSKYNYLQIVFDINTGDFENDMFIKTIPAATISYNSETNEDFSETYVDPVTDNIDWDSLFETWNNTFSPNANVKSLTLTDRNEFDQNYLGKVSATRLLKKKQSFKQLGADLGQASWTQVKIRKNEFLRHGSDDSKGWADVAAVKIVALTTDTGIDISVDDLKLIGGGKLEADRYKVSYSYVSKYTLPDGTDYIEESKLSPEAEVTDAERQNILVTSIAASPDTQVTHKRVYIRGGGLTLRHRAGEIEIATVTDPTTFTIDEDEEELVIELVEDARENGLAPVNPVQGVVANGSLFLVKGKNLHWSRSLLPFAFRENDFITLPYDIKAIYKNGSNISILMENGETVYVNPSLTAAEGGYLFDSTNPQGCMSTRSAKNGYHLSHEGIVFYRTEEPSIISQRIRQDLLAHSEAFRSNAIGAYLKGRYYLCIPDASVMYEFDSVNNRFIKHTDVIDVTAKDGDIVYVLKSDGIYSFETNIFNRKKFTYRSPEIVFPDSGSFHNFVIDGDLGSSGVTIEYFVNNTSETSITKTSDGRKRTSVSIKQKPGSRVSAKISTSSGTTDVDQAIYGVYLQ